MTRPLSWGGPHPWAWTQRGAGPREAQGPQGGDSVTEA